MDFAAAGDAVAVVHEILLHGWSFDACFFVVACVEIGAGFEGVDAVVEAGA